MKKLGTLFALSLANILASAPANNALSFDGLDDQVSFVNQPLKDASSFTIEAMIFNENPNPDQDVFMQFYDDADTRFELRLDQGQLAIYSQQLWMSGLYYSSFTVPVGKYFHLALVKSGSITKLYADDKEVLTLDGDYSLGTTLRLGRYFVHDTYSFKGKIDELRMWNAAKTPAQIKYASKCGLKGTEPNLVGYWNFNAGLAYGSNDGVTKLEDLTANKNHGYMSNFALTGSRSNWVSSGTGCGEVINGNSALAFDGIDDQVYFSNHSLKDASSFTIEAVVLNENPSPNQDVFMQFFDDTDTRFELRLDQGKLALYCQQLDLYNLFVSSYTVPVDKYFHVALVKNGAITKVYVNNEDVLTVAGEYSLGATLRLGRYFSNEYYSFKGKIDELRMWNVAKTSDQIKYSRKCGLTGNESKLVGYWNFNDGEAYADNQGFAILSDGTPYGNDGHLDNFALEGTTSNWVASGTGCIETSMAPLAEEEEAILALLDAKLSDEASLYPNPASTWVEISGVPEGAPVELYDAVGRLYISAEVKDGKVQLPASMMPGLYRVAVKGAKAAKFVMVKE